MPICMTTFADVIQKAHRAKVIVVSPNILMLAINTIQTVMKDARMREQADLIQKEVGVLVKDVKRLGERVEQAAAPLRPGRSRHQGHRWFRPTRSSAGREKIEKVELAPPEGHQKR